MIYNEKLRTMTTDRLILRMFNMEDAEVTSRLCNNYNLAKSTLGLPYPYTVECATGWISTHKEQFDNDKMYTFAIVDKNTDELYGCISISNNKAHRHGEIGYWVGEQYWGNGYATEAAEAVIEFAFNVKGYHRVFARHYASNPASGRVMQKAGMIYEGEFKEHIYKDGRFESLINYGAINK